MTRWNERRKPPSSRSIKAISVAALLLINGVLTACSSTDDTASATAPPPAGPTTPIAAGIDRAGACEGVAIEPGANVQRVLDSHPAGTTYCFGRGLFRINAPLKPQQGDTLASSTGAIISGSRIIKTWSREGAHWVARDLLPAPYERVGKCEDNRANPCHQGEQIFVDGNHLDRVTSKAKLAPGKFFQDYENDLTYLADDPAGKLVEMSHALSATDGNVPRVTVRGLTIQHFASRPQKAALTVGDDWLVEANEVRWNHAVGILVARGDRARLLHNKVVHNGQLGISQHRSEHVLMAGNEVSRNNTDGFWVIDWESGGIKSTRSSGLIENNLVEANLGNGIWSDVADYDRHIRTNRIIDNAADGIRYEISYDGTIERNLVVGNGFFGGRGSGPTLLDGAGINVNTASGVTITGNVVSGNLNGISLQSRPRGNGPRGPYVLRDVTVKVNRVTMTKGSAKTGVAQLGDADIPAGTVKFRKNSYDLEGPEARRFETHGRDLTPAQWQAAGFDPDGRFD